MTVKNGSKTEAFERQKGKGRPKGSQNKTTALLKDAILRAAEKAGNKVGDEGLVSYLEDQAEKSPRQFLALLGKVLPMQLTGPDGDGLFKGLDIVIRRQTGD